MLIIIGNEKQREELFSSLPGKQLPPNCQWVDELTITDADIYIDLLFNGSIERVNALKAKAQFVLINNVCGCLFPLPQNFIRFNGWSGFLKNEIIEAAYSWESSKQKAEEVFSLFHKKIDWAPDTPGFVSARIIAMIINEAYLAVQENITDKQAINTAMKSGTSYPYGPFEWADKIDIQNIYELLNALAEGNNKYRPCDLLIKEAISQ